MLLTASNLPGAIKTQKIEYKQGDTTMVGYLAYDDSTTAKRPGVLVVHEWWGRTDYIDKRAQMLAQLGYVAFAVDMYGKGQTVSDAAKAGELAGQVRSDMKVAMARAQAGLDVLKAQPMVDGDRIASIGYCFGGTMALYMARNNFPLRGVVSFHGDLSGPTTPAGNIKPKVLVCHGADDTFVPQPAVSAFMDEMKKSHADWQLNQYSGAVHAFSNPDVGQYKLPGTGYNKQADERSWQAMKDFLGEIFR
jgi:dienelactone hydrolase